MNRWYFWVLAPIMLVTAIGMPFITSPPTWQGTVILYVFCAALLFAALGLARPGRFRWALKIVAGAILAAYLGYVVYELAAWWRGKPFGLVSPKSQSNLRNALLGLVAFGAPAFYFIRRGRSGAAIDVLLDVEDHPTTCHAFDFQSDREAAAFIAALSRQLDAPQGRAAARGGIVEIWACREHDGRTSVFLSPVAFTVAQRAFSAIPPSRVCGHFNWPEYAVLVMDNQSIQPMGIDDVSRCLASDD